MKKIFCIALCVAALLACSSCGNDKAVNKDALAPFIGEWDCQESTLEERGNEDYSYVGYLDLRVEEDGTFSMYDGEAGNPGMYGKMYPETDGTVELDCAENDFDPPYHWYILGMDTEDQLQYSFHEDNGTELLYLSYKSGGGSVSTLVFERWK